jgi:polyhydroxyalkanoate synthesis repressor PhaR
MATRVIRRYGNRRLYDPAQKRYVNLDEIAQLIRDGEAVEIQDAKTGKDLTRATLTQIIMEDTKTRNGGLPTELLHELVALSGKGAQGLMWYLHSALDTYRKAQRAPVDLVRTLLSPLASRAAEPPPEQAAVEELLRRVEEMERQLAQQQAPAKRK